MTYTVMKYKRKIMGNSHLNSNQSVLLLKKFNSRDKDAFGEIYLLYYDDLFYFASRLYRDTEISAHDIIHDVFINLWENKKQLFLELNNIKAYLFISVKNNFKNYLTHRKCIDKYKYNLMLDDDAFISQVAETEIFSYIAYAVDLLPEECGKVFQCYLDGLETKEIAKKFNKSESTVYNQKKDAIDYLKKKLPKDKILIIIMLLS